APVKAAPVASANCPATTSTFITASSIPQQITADDQPHHLVGAFQDLVDAHVAQDPLDRMIAQVAVAAVKLQAAVDDIEAGVGGVSFGHGGEPRAVRLALRQCDGG